FGSVRNKSGGGTRYHKGYDANVPRGTLVPPPSINKNGASVSCNVMKPPAGLNAATHAKGVPSNAANPTIGQEWLWATDPGGYGYYMVFDCSNVIGKEMLVRYAHVEGFNDGQQVITGRTAINSSAPHVHVEVALQGTLVDPECLWGSRPDRKCPTTGKPDLCGSDYDAMKQDCVNNKMDTGNCQSKIPGSGTSTAVSNAYNTPGADKPHTEAEVYKGGAPPDTDGEGDFPPGEYTYTPPIDDGPGGGGGGDPDPPITPPDPDVPGNPGSNPTLTPEPTTEPEELSGCAADTWTAMVNQAVMETRREDILNKRFIVKPDSVIDYSCYDLYVKKTGESAGPIFSETKKWANLPVDLIGKTVVVQRELGSKSLDNSLMSTVQSVVTNYRRGQFNNPMLAGSAPVSVTAGQTNCDVMAKVWKAAKCKNFDDVAVFYTFNDLRTKEPREYPANMKCN
ncbi:MAG TPA: hypothetical protein PLF01_05475, partial [Alphaproteobacteria bacterium]|nr:hypothetical protein [Alphaproteobacteria bacterium]